MKVICRVSSALGMIFILLLSTSLPAAAESNSLAANSAAVFTGINFVSNIETIGIAVSGTASNGSLTGLKPFEMPKDGTKFVSFSCSNIGPTLDITNDVLKEVLAIKPTRIETRVFKIGAPLPPTDPTTKNGYRVLAGHGFVGHTDVPATP